MAGNSSKYFSEFMHAGWMEGWEGSWRRPRDSKILMSGSHRNNFMLLTGSGPKMPAAAIGGVDFFIWGKSVISVILDSCDISDSVILVIGPIQ